MKKKQDRKDMPFLQHLEVLRWHIVRSLLGVLFFAIIAFIFKDYIFDVILLAPKNSEFFTNAKLCEFGHFIGTEALCINTKPFKIINITLAGQFSTHITVSIVAGFMIAFPYVFFEFWRFILPALQNKERKHSRGTVFFTSILFSFGGLFGYFVILPLSVHFLGSYTVSKEVVNTINLNSYIQTFTSVILAAGVIFELPVFIFFLSKIGLVTPALLKKYRKHSLVTILALSAIITPPDIFSQVLVSFPLIILYEIGILISKRVVKKDKSVLV